MDSCIYEVEFLDGVRQHIAYNILAEHLLSSEDLEGNQFQIFKAIVDHWKDNCAIEKLISIIRRMIVIIKRRRQLVGSWKLNGGMGPHHGYL